MSMSSECTQSELIQPALQESQAPEQSQLHITSVIEYMQSFQEASVEILSSRLSLSPQIVRLLRYQLQKTRKQDLATQPFSFLRPKFRSKPYDICKGVKVDLEHLLKQMHKESYEEISRRLQEQGLQLMYPQIKYALKKYGLYDKQKVAKDSQIPKLIALHLAQLKMRRTPLVYIDMANLKLTPSHLVIGPPTPKTNSGIHIQLAISPEHGLLGYQIYSALPSSSEPFITKLNKKLKADTYTVVMPCTVERLSLKHNLVQLPNEDCNQKLNSARGVWPLIAQMFENSVDTDSDFSQRMGQILSAIEPQTFQQIARSFNNAGIVKEMDLSKRPKPDQEDIILEKF